MAASQQLAVLLVAGHLNVKVPDLIDEALALVFKHWGAHGTRRPILLLDLDCQEGAVLVDKLRGREVLVLIVQLCASHPLLQMLPNGIKLHERMDDSKHVVLERGNWR